MVRFELLLGKVIVIAGLVAVCGTGAWAGGKSNRRVAPEGYHTFDVTSSERAQASFEVKGEMGITVTSNFGDITILPGSNDHFTIGYRGENLDIKSKAKLEISEHKEGNFEIKAFVPSRWCRDSGRIHLVMQIPRDRTWFVNADAGNGHVSIPHFESIGDVSIIARSGNVSLKNLTFANILWVKSYVGNVELSNVNGGAMHVEKVGSEDQSSFRGDTLTFTDCNGEKAYTSGWKTTVLGGSGNIRTPGLVIEK